MENEGPHPPISCTLAESQRYGRESLIRKLFQAAEEIESFDQGIEARFSGDSEWLRKITDVAVIERECCQFLRFEIIAEPELGPIVLRIMGPTGTGDFLKTWVPSQMGGG